MSGVMYSTTLPSWQSEGRSCCYFSLVQLTPGFGKYLANRGGRWMLGYRALVVPPMHESIASMKEKQGISTVTAEEASPGQSIYHHSTER